MVGISPLAVSHGLFFVNIGISSLPKQCSRSSSNGPSETYLPNLGRCLRARVRPSLSRETETSFPLTRTETRAEIRHASRSACRKELLISAALAWRCASTGRALVFAITTKKVTVRAADGSKWLRAASAFVPPTKLQSLLHRHGQDAKRGPAQLSATPGVCRTGRRRFGSQLPRSEDISRGGMSYLRSSSRLCIRNGKHRRERT